MRANPTAIVSALFLAEMTAVFEGSMLYAALPKLMIAFGDPALVGWLVTIHMLTGAAACVLSGRLGDIFGRRRISLILLGVGTVGSLLSVVSDSFSAVLVGRALQGLCVAILPLSIGIIREELPALRVPVSVGLMSTAAGAGSAAGLVLGGVIVDYLHWQWLFGASAVLLVVSCIAMVLFVPGRSGVRPQKPIDWIEGLLPAPGILAILLGISLAKQRGWDDALIIGLVVVGAAVLTVWARRSLRSEEPFINLRLLGQREVALANLISIFMALGTLQLVLVFTTYMQAPAWTLAGLGLTATVAGLAKLPANALALAAGPLSGWLVQKRGNRVPVILGGAMAAGGWLFALGMPATVGELMGFMVMITFGTALLNATLPIVIIAGVPQERTSESIATMTVARGMFGAVGAQFISLLLASQTVTAPGIQGAFPVPEAFRLTMIWMASLSFAVAVAGYFLADGRRTKQAGKAAVAGQVGAADV